jgi:hypothetical protein
MQRCASDSLIGLFNREHGRSMLIGVLLICGVVVYCIYRVMCDGEEVYWYCTSSSCRAFSVRFSWVQQILQYVRTYELRISLT